MVVVAGFEAVRGYQVGAGGDEVDPDGAGSQVRGAVDDLAVFSGVAASGDVHVRAVGEPVGRARQGLVCLHVVRFLADVCWFNHYLGSDPSGVTGSHRKAEWDGALGGSVRRGEGSPVQVKVDLPA